MSNKHPYPERRILQVLAREGPMSECLIKKWIHPNARYRVPSALERLYTLDLIETTNTINQYGNPIWRKI